MRKNRFQKGLGLSLIGGAVLILAACTSLSQAQGAEKQVEIERLQDIENPDAEFTVDLWVDRKDPTYKVGEEVTFAFKANRDCRLTLFNVATSGKVHILFPNEHHKDNLVKAGQTYQVPPKGARFRFKAQGPVGEDVVKAIATLEKVSLVNPSDVKPTGGFQEITTSEKDIVIEIQESLAPVNPKRWTEAEQAIKIVE